MKKTNGKRLTLTKDTLARVTGGETVALTVGCTIINSAVLVCVRTVRYTCFPAACEPAGTTHSTISGPGPGG